MNWQQRIDRARTSGGFLRVDRKAAASWLTSPTGRIDCPRLPKGQPFDPTQPKGFIAVGVEPRNTRLRTLDIEFGTAVNDGDIEKAQQLLEEIATVATSLGYGQR